MCGRYVNVASSADISAEFAVTTPADDLPELAPSWSIRPTDQVLGVIDRNPEGGDRSRELHVFRWGVVPSWSKNTKGAARMINARVEGLAEKPAWRRLVAKRRGVVPMAGWYEWTERADPAGGKKPLKIPHYIHRADDDGGLLAAAALYEWWRNPDLGEDDPDRWLATIAIVTRDSVDEVAEIHTRQPLFLERGSVDAWLDPQLVDGQAARQLLLDQRQPPFAEREVSREVNRPGASGPQLIDPVEGHSDRALVLAAS
jgi:putative SOS response-associated peptidase YedK